jgi:hypothetical protein
MRYSLYNQFGALNSGPIFEAVKHGLCQLGHTVCHHDDSADVAVIWSQLWAGRMKANKQVWDLYRSTQRTVLVIEVGSLHRGHTWRIMPNGVKTLWSKGNNSERFDALGLKLLPWRQQGSHVLIACQRPESQQWQGYPGIDQWLKQTVAGIQKQTDRPIFIRPHPRHRLTDVPAGCKLLQPRPIAGTYDNFDFDRDLYRAWCVVNLNSNPAVDAVLKGIPVFVDSTSMAAPVGNLDWNKIETPEMPNREQWAWDLAHSEFYISELESGSAFQWLANDSNDLSSHCSTKSL